MRHEPEHTCSIEAAIRRQMAEANYAGQWGRVTELTYALTDHLRDCPVCSGKAAEMLFGRRVEVRG